MQSDSARVLPPQDDVRALLKSVFREDVAADGAFTAAGMAVSELVELYKLAQTAKDAPALEVGMANATSSIVICGALATRDKGHLTSIDPFQLSEYRNAGLANVARAGFAERHQLIDEPDYLALPRLVGEGRRFGFIFVDGWHSFDYAMLDIFFADLLLEDGGVLALHDTDWPPVYKAVRFLETHKPYDRLSPAPAVALDGLLPRVTRRVRTALEGRHAVSQAHARRTRWRSLSAYRKRNSQTTLQRLEAAF